MQRIVLKKRDDKKKNHPMYLLPSPSMFSLPPYSTGGGVDGRLEGSRKEMAAVHAAALSSVLIALGPRHTAWRLAHDTVRVDVEVVVRLVVLPLLLRRREMRTPGLIRNFLEGADGAPLVDAHDVGEVAIVTFWFTEHTSPLHCHCRVQKSKAKTVTELTLERRLARSTLLFLDSCRFAEDDI